MASRPGPLLDSPPPLPPELAGGQEALGTLAGGRAGAGIPPGMEQPVLERAKMAEMVLNALGNLLPSVQPDIAEFVAKLRSKVMASLQGGTAGPAGRGGAQPQPSAVGGGAVASPLPPMGPG